MELQRGAITCISNLCINQENHEIVLREGGLALLKQLARTSKDMRIKQPIANAFANLATVEDNVSELVKDDGLELLISFTNERDSELVSGAIHTIANLADADNMKQKIFAAGGLDVVVRLLSSTHSKIVEGAANALANLTTEQECQVRSVELGVAKSLVSLLKKSKNTEILLRVSIAISNIVSNPDLRPPLVAAECIRPLYVLSRMRNQDVRREATEALNELAEFTGEAKKLQNAVPDADKNRLSGGDENDTPIRRIRVQPIDFYTREKCSGDRVLDLSRNKLPDLFSNISATFKRKCTSVYVNKCELNLDDQLVCVKSGDVLEATFSLQCNVQRFDYRNGNHIGLPFSVEISSCNLVWQFFFQDEKKSTCVHGMGLKLKLPFSETIAARSETANWTCPLSGSVQSAACKQRYPISQCAKRRHNPSGLCSYPPSYPNFSPYYTTEPI